MLMAAARLPIPPSLSPAGPDAGHYGEKNTRYPICGGGRIGSGARWTTQRSTRWSARSVRGPPCAMAGTANTMSLVARYRGCRSRMRRVPRRHRRKNASPGPAAAGSWSWREGVAPRTSCPATRWTRSAPAPLGSTNAALHIPAIAAELGLDITPHDFDRISRETPTLCKLKSLGAYAPGFHRAGGALALLHDGSAAYRSHDGSGKTIGETRRGRQQGYRVIRPLSDAYATHGGYAVLRATSAPRADRQADGRSRADAAPHRTGPRL